MKMFRADRVRATRLSGICCDRCGCEARRDKGISDVFAMQEYLSVEFTAGYGAKAFIDGTHYSCELCETCVKDLLGSYLRAEKPRWREFVLPNRG